MKNYDLAIVGFGPVGAAAANMFAESGFNIIVVEPKYDIWDIPRAVHFDGQTQRIFQSMGIFDQIQEIIDPILGVNFINRNGKELLSVSFESHPKLNGYYDGVMFNQPKFEEILRKNVSKYSNIELKLGWQVDKLDCNIDSNLLEITNNATNQTESLTSTYVIAADGADSFVRKNLNIKMHDYKCDQDWVVVDYLLDKKYKVLNKSRYQICDYKRPTTLLPITNNHIRWEFKINPEDDLEQLESEKNIRSFMEPHIWRLNPDIDINSGTLIRSSKYSFHGLLVDEFKINNCFLIGDAAHQTPPFLGQGLCQGIKDSYNLCWKLKGVNDGIYNKKILDTFSIERREINDFMIRTAIKQGNVIGTQNMVKAFIRDTFFSIAKIFPKALSALKFQYSWKLNHGLIDKDLFPNGANGVIIPQPDINIRVNNKQFDQYLGESFSLIILDEDETLIDDISNIEFMDIFKNNIHIFNSKHPFLKDGRLAKWSRENCISAAIIRPDKHIYGCCDGVDIIKKIEKLVKNLHNEVNT
jgi:3-(3-hydroxy-phenyl)propionate hydroxylase